MKEFMELYADKIVGALSGWDRIRFRGTFRWLASLCGLNSFIGGRGLLLKDFKHWAQGLTDNLRAACEQQANELCIPTEYLRSSGVNKEARAREIAAERGIEVGDICMFSVVEQCMAPTVRGNRSTRQLDLVITPRRCVHIYHYWVHPQLGFGHSRLQTWLPFNVTICINGRHWLERQLMQEGIRYAKDDNCFPYIADLGRAQELANAQLRTSFPPLLDEIVRRNCPVVEGLFGSPQMQYYWSADQTEWATDIVFRSQADLDQIYPTLLLHGMLTADSRAVMRFFGRSKVVRLPEDVVSDYRRRFEGLRLKHWMKNNSVKAYNKAGRLLRIETTINNARDFKVYRRANDDPAEPMKWQHMRKGVADLHRRAEVSQACNNRYAQHLAAHKVHDTLRQVAGDICKRTRRKGRPYRALNPWNDEDYRTLTFLARGEHAINGFRNRDLRQALYPKADGNDVEKRRASGRSTRRLQLLRAHGLIKKVPRSTRYLLTAKGRRVTAAILAASSADTEKLMACVA